MVGRLEMDWFKGLQDLMGAFSQFMMRAYLSIQIERAFKVHISIHRG